jgi:hypothetical protein
MRSLGVRGLPVIWWHALDGADGEQTSTGMSTPDRKPDLSGQTQTSGGPSPDAEFRELWAALRLIRETVEELAPPGSVPNDEYLSPEPMREAEAIIRGIYAIDGSRSGSVPGS